MKLFTLTIFFTFVALTGTYKEDFVVALKEGAENSITINLTDLKWWLTGFLWYNKPELAMILSSIWSSCPLTAATFTEGSFFQALNKILAYTVGNGFFVLTRVLLPYIYLLHRKRTLEANYQFLDTD